MVFTYVRWKRSPVAGVASYLAGHLAMFSLSPDTVRRAMATTSAAGEELPPLSASVPADVARCKMLGWPWHGSLFAPMATHYPLINGTKLVNPMTGIAGTHPSLFAVGPAGLFLAGFLVVLCS